MRVLLLLRGAPGCGKSTWIERNGLKPYALSADDIRLLCQSPIMTPEGTVAISQANDKITWNMLFKLLDNRMQKGEFTVIDATNSKTAEMNRYKEMCSTYKYRIYCVDFTDVPIEVAKERNAQREELKRVPEEVIDKMYSRFATQKIPSGIAVIKPNELDKIWMKKIDLSEYKMIHHIGDIHGCYTALNEYITSNGGIKDDNFYIFTGDYIDRGIENAEVLEFLISIKDKKNVLLLEGNHELWLRIWANGGTGKSKEFELITKPQIEHIDKKDIRQLYRKLGQCAYYSYHGNDYLVTHAGLSFMPENLTFVATEQMIKGVGNYNDYETVANTWTDVTPDNYYQIFGHRNTKSLPIRINDRVFDLEGAVEFGGDLRAVQLSEAGLEEKYIKNTVYKKPEQKAEEKITNTTLGDMVIAMRSNKYIQEKKFGNISSFNFTSKAFYGKVWDEQTVKARGLFIDTKKGNVIARSYPKFFNVNERPETKFDMLQYKLQFPVTAYVKENGFLGMVSYDPYTDDLFITSKSNPEGDFSDYLKDMIYDKIDSNSRIKMKDYIKENNVTFVFECVDMKNDPHIIDYEQSELFLLDIVHNDMEFSKYDYNLLCNVANQFGLKHKEKAYEIGTWQEFFDWYYEVTAEDYEYNGRYIEGFVIEDSVGYMVKLKLAYYNFWKFMRNISHECIRKGYINKTSALTTPLANEYYYWAKGLHEWENKDEIPRDICTLRKLFYIDKQKEKSS